MSAHHIQGGCLCGAVKISATVEHPVFDACHCGMCRTWGGGPFMTVHAQPGLRLEGKDSISLHASSEWAERGFCKSCGTHLFYHLKEKDEYFLSAGLFPNTAEFKFMKQIFIDRKPHSYAFANDTEKLTEAEVFADAGGRINN